MRHNFFLKRKKAQVDFRVKNTFYSTGGFTVLGNYDYYRRMNRFVSVFGEFFPELSLCPVNFWSFFFVVLK